MDAGSTKSRGTWNNQSDSRNLSKAKGKSKKAKAEQGRKKSKKWKADGGEEPLYSVKKGQTALDHLPRAPSHEWLASFQKRLRDQRLHLQVLFLMSSSLILVTTLFRVIPASPLNVQVFTMTPITRSGRLGFGP